MNRRNLTMLACVGALGFQATMAGDVTGSGTTDAIPLWTSSTAIGNSIMTQSGATVNVAGTVNASTAFSLGGYPVLTTPDICTAVGIYALNADPSCTQGATAVGYFSLLDNTTGTGNTSVGGFALRGITTGSSNTALGYGAATLVTTGSNNIFIGEDAGISLTGASSYNVDIGTSGTAGDNGAIRIGTAGDQTSFYAAGITGVNVSGAEVYVSSTGQLGIKSSSLRYKEDVHDMAGASDGLFRLRPVTYRYKQAFADGSRPIDYGLIAEEVAQVYPDLVAKNKDGQIETVEYSKLTPMLVNELQKQHQAAEQQAKMVEQQAETMQQQADTIRSLEQRLAALEQAAAKK